MRWSKALLGLLFLGAACVSRAPLPNVETASSVHLDARVMACTAIHIGDGLILTAEHCVRQPPIIIENHYAALQWANYSFDVALLLVPGMSNAPSSALACRAPLVGEEVMMIGDTEFQQGIYRFGKVASKIYAHKDRSAIVLFDMRGAPGNSGAPVYDVAGNVIAMVIAVAPDLGDKVVAVPGSALCGLIKRSGATVPPSPS